MLSKSQNQLNKQHNFKSCLYDHITRLVDKTMDGELMELVSTPLQEKDYTKYVEVNITDLDTGKVRKEKRYGVVTAFHKERRDQVVEAIRLRIPEANIADNLKIGLTWLVMLYRKMDKELPEKEWRGCLHVTQRRYGAAYY